MIHDDQESTEADPASLDPGWVDSWRLVADGRVPDSECGATLPDEAEVGLGSVWLLVGQGWLELVELLMVVMTSQPDC